MGNAFDGVRYGMGEVVHRVDAPFVACPMVRSMDDTVKDRIAHVEVRAGHIDFGAQYLFAIGKLAGFHIFKELQVFFDAAVTAGAFLPRRIERAAVFTDFITRQIIDISLTQANQLFGVFIEFIEIVRRIEHAVVPVKTEPFDIAFNRFYIFRIFFRRIRVIKAEIRYSAIFLGNAEIQADRLGVADVEIAIRFRRETGMDPLAICILFVVFIDNSFNKIFGRFVIHRCISLSYMYKCLQYHIIT